MDAIDIFKEAIGSRLNPLIVQYDVYTDTTSKEIPTRTNSLMKLIAQYFATLKTPLNINCQE